MSDIQIYSIDQILKLNKIGLVPGPFESAQDFTIRASYCLHLKKTLLDDIQAAEGSKLRNELEQGMATTEVCDEPSRELSYIYDIKPSWIPLFYSNFKLPIWNGGAAWIFQMQENSPTAALIQLRKVFNVNKKYLWIYDRDELLRHELSHVGRMKFEEPKYEEVLAYRTSKNKFRRFFGALFQSSIESFMFLLVLGLIVAIDFFLISTGRNEGYMMALWFKVIPVFLIAAAICRVTIKNKTLEKCLMKLKKNFDGEGGSAVLYRLTDEEIDLFSKESVSFIKEYIENRASEELRMEVIWKGYPRI